MTRSRARQASTWGWVDPALAATGASRGFTILVIGGLSVPLVAALVPVLGSVWLTLTSIVAFVAAAWRAGAADAPARQGALNALCAYLLVLPLVLIASGDPSPVQIGVTAAVALVVGAGAGWARGRAERAPVRR